MVACMGNISDHRANSAGWQVLWQLPDISWCSLYDLPKDALSRLCWRAGALAAAAGQSGAPDVRDL